jgi:hypothetical protein
MVSFTPRPLYPQGKNRCYPLDRRLGGPRAVLDAVVKRKFPSPRRESNPRTPVVQPIAQRYTDRAIRALTLADGRMKCAEIDHKHAYKFCVCSQWLTWQGCETLRRCLINLRQLESVLQGSEENIWLQIAGGWRSLHNEKLHNLYASPNVITVNKSVKMKWAENLARMGEMKSAWKFWSEDLKGKDREGVDLIDLAQDRDQRRAFVNTAMNVWIP